MFPVENYKYVVRAARTDENGIEHGPEVIAISHYAGQTVKGVAKCSPNDEFSLDYGKQLAAARCNMNVLKKRVKTLAAKSVDVYRQIARLEVEESKIDMALQNACNDMVEARRLYMSLLKNN